MIPILYSSSETTFVSNGIGRLSECLRCEVTEERNGVYELELELPITARHYADISEGMIVSVIHDDTKTRQPFIIYKRTAPIDGVVTFYAHHISYLLTGIVLRPYQAETAAEALALMPTYSMNTNPFTFWTDKTGSGSFEVKVPTGCRQILGGMEGSVLDVFGGGEYEFDNYTVKLHASRGRDTDVQIRYSKNLVNLENNIDISGSYGGVVAYWADEDTTIYSSVVYADGYSDGCPIASIDMSSKYQEEPTAATLTTAAAAYLSNNTPYEPNVNISVDFVALWQTPEYADIAPLERVGLCDTVSVIYPELGVNCRREVIKVTYDVLNERYTELELGTPKTTLIGLAEKTAEDIMQSIPVVSRIAAAVEHATDLITGGLGGYVVMTMNADGQPQEILIMDSDDITSAVNVIRMNQNGIGFSTTGYQGPFTNAWTIDGHLVADFVDTGTLNASLITAGTMLADRILGGTLKLGGTSDGVLSLYNANDVQVMNIDKTGTWFKFTDGQFSSGYGYIIIGATSLVNFGSRELAIYGDSIANTNEIFSISKETGTDSTAGKTFHGTILGGGSNSNEFRDYIQLESPLNSHYLRLYNSNTNDTGYEAILNADLKINGEVYVNGNFTVPSNKTKSNLVDTADYGKRLMYCCEMPSPVYEDFGTGETDASGVCYVAIDDILRESLADVEYSVFLQKEGSGDLWVEEKSSQYFVVRGSAGLRFSWSLKAIQIDMDGVRSEAPDLYNFDPKLIEETDLGIYSDELENYYYEMESALYEDAE